MLTFPRDAYDEVVDQARTGAPREVCGVLGGDFGDEASRVTSVHAAENVADDPETTYYVDPGDQLAITDRIEDAGDDVVGFYHSHPAGPTAPSETDAERATWPDHSYVIVCLDGAPYVGAWRWNGTDGTFEQETVRLD